MPARTSSQSSDRRPQVGRVAGSTSRCQAARSRARVHRAEIADDRGVDVDAAGVGEAVGGEHLEPGRRAPDHRGVERAGAEVVDDHARARPAPCAVGGVHERPAGRDRLRHQRRRRQPGPHRGGVQHARSGCGPSRPGYVERRRVDRRRRRPGAPRRPPGPAPPRSCRPPRRRRRPAAPTASSMRRFGFGSKPSGRARAACTASRPDEQPPVPGQADGRRQDRRPVDEKLAHGAVRRREHGNGVGRAEVHPEAKPDALPRSQP